jgi:NAD(P)-dependent dehydrogenase (short-subunit alcohol dehydrogenase family)
MREFKGKTAFVTGGACGIGFALAGAFADAGMRVMVADIQEKALDQALTELKGSEPVRRCEASFATSPILRR